MRKAICATLLIAAMAMFSFVGFARGEEEEPQKIRYFHDNDGDTYGDRRDFIELNPGEKPPAGYLLHSLRHSCNDCNDDDPTIHPDAPERCGDGIDQDCDKIDLVCPEMQSGS